MSNSQSGKDAEISFGHLIFEARTAAGETQPRVAERAKISRVHLSHVENDRREPGLFVALRLLRALGIDPKGLGNVRCEHQA